MKHPPSVVIALLVLFILSQVIGLFILNNDIAELPFGIERPDVEPNQAWIFLAPQS